MLSSNGLDAIKLGMSTTEVEKAIGGTLQPDTPDSAAQKDSTLCKECTQYYKCKYKDLTLALTFFRHTMYEKSDYELAAIAAFPASALVRTKSGIATGMSEKEFLDNCTGNGYRFAKMGADKKNSGYFFSVSLNMKSSKMLCATFTDGVLTQLMAVNMIGD
jgi:hypothetical protein